MGKVGAKLTAGLFHNLVSSDVILSHQQRLSAHGIPSPGIKMLVSKDACKYCAGGRYLDW